MNRTYSLQDRANFYRKAFPKFPAPRADDRWLDAMWVTGNDYKGSGYYGAYPPAYLKRMLSMFPDAENVLHVFSGSLPKGNYTRVDINPNLKPDIVASAEDLYDTFNGKPYFDLTFVDPPYSKEDAERYGYPMPNRKKVLEQCAMVTEGYIVWLDTMLPMYRKKELKLVGLIGIVRSTNHRFRIASIFETQ